MATLIQTKPFKRRTFQTASDCIRVVDRNFLDGRSYDVPYAVLFGDRVELETTAVSSLYAAGGVMALSVVFTLVFRFDPKADWSAGLWGAGTFVAAICLFVHWLLSRQRMVQFYDRQSFLFVRRDRPSVEAVDAFIAEATRIGRERVRSEVLPLGRSDNERKDRAYAYLLRDKGIISAEECAEYVKPAHSPYRDRLG